MKNIYKKLKNLIEKEYPNETNIIELSLEILLNLIITDEEIVNDKQIILDLIRLVNDIINKFESIQKVLYNSLRILFQITNNNTENEENKEIYLKIMNKMIELNLLLKLIDKIDKFDINEKNIIHCCLRIIGNFVAIDDGFYTDKVIEYNFLDKLKKFIQNNQQFENRKEATWILSNIAAGTNQQLLKLYENNFQYILFDIISNEEESKIKNNCLWSLYNFSNINNSEYLDILVEKGFIDIIIERFKIDGGDTLCCSLEALGKILNDGEKKDPANFNIIQTKVNELNVLNELKVLLKKFPVGMIKDKIVYILNNNFDIEDINQFLNDNSQQNQ